MAETYSVKAVLSAYDKGFSAAMKNATKSTDALGSKIKSGLGFGVLTGIGQQAFSVLANGARDLMGEISASNAAWKTFNGNMKMLGMGKKEIKEVRNELQEFAEQTIYSSSDMAQTYSQLAAVGTKNCNKLVKGFGGLAAAAENPQQAMKTLSQQATQMAAKPIVAWQDFKLMLEQTPAGIAAVAKEMGMSTSELVKNVQNGTVATEDFFDAISKVGTNEAFTKLATEYKTVGQAMDGLKETLGNKLTPAFDVLSERATGGLNKIIDKLGKIDAEKLADKFETGLEKAQPYWDMFVKTLKVVGGILKPVGKGLKAVGGFLLDHADACSKLLPVLLGVGVGFKAFKKIPSWMSPFKKAKDTLDDTGKSSSRATTAMDNLKNSVSSLAKNAGIALIIGSLALLAKSMQGIGALGSSAVAPLTTFGLVVAGLMGTFALLGDRLEKSAIGMVAFSGSLSMMAIAMGPVANAGAEGTKNMTAFGLVVAGLVGVFALFSGALGAATLPMVVFAGTILAVGVALNLASPFVTAFSNLVTACGTAVATATDSISNGFLKVSEGIAVIINAVSGGFVGILNGIANVINSIGTSAKNAGAGFKLVAQGIELIAGLSVGAIAKSLGAVAIGMGSIANKGKNLPEVASALQRLTIATTSCTARLNSFNSSVRTSANVLGTAGTAAGNKFASGLNNGTKKAVNTSKSDVKAITTVFKSGKSSAYSAGRNIGLGLAQGIESAIPSVRSAANRLVAQADRAIRAKAKIHSPSKLTDKLGGYFGQGFVDGIKDKFSEAKTAARNLVNIPRVNQLAYAGEFGSDYTFGDSGTVIVEVPVILDGKEVSRVVAPHMRKDLNKLDSRESRKRGKR